MLLTASGCINEPEVKTATDESTEQTMQTTESAEAPDTAEAEQTTASTTTTTTAPVVEVLPTEKSFLQFTAEELRDFSVYIYDGSRKMCNVYDSLLTDIYEYHSDGASVESEFICYRDSSCALKQTESELAAAVEPMTYSGVYNGAYDLKAKHPRLYISADEDGKPQLDSAAVEYSIYDDITLTGFMKYGSSDMYSFIIDPAYTMGIPMMTSRTEYMQFDINGTEIFADTLQLIVMPKGCDITDEIGEDYVYVRLTFDELTVRYDTVSGYSNTGRFSAVEVLTEDTESVLGNLYLFEGEEKDPRMTEAYNAITGSLDSIYKDTTHGMIMLDMDFDGTPELLVSDAVKRGISDYDGEPDHYDTSIYRIENGALRYIDKMTFTSDYFTSGLGMGLKTLEDGTKGWYASSYINRETGATDERIDYIYKLEGDTLTAIEKFRSAGEEYFIDGQPITMSTREEYVSFYDEEPELTTIYEWGDYSSFFGPNIVFGDIKHDYVADISEQYMILSDWLCDFNSSGYSQLHGMVNSVYTLTDRELSYRIAYLVDCAYLGEYNPAKNQYYYEFYGGFAKPVIYLYPEQQTDVSVEVGFANGGELTCTYPEYNDGWRVTALPDGTLYDESGNEYYCLYWEGEGSATLDMSRGWCVSGKDSADFLREKLLHIGLTPREANEFIIYWLPQLEQSEYNVISLHTEQYAAAVPLNVVPAPDSEIRVFMTFTPVGEYVEIAPQELPSYDRTGFTLVEWGGGIVE